MIDLMHFFQCDGCIETCHSETRDCYVIDNNGYVILSESSNDTGRFFGEVEGAILKSLVEKELFAIIPVFDLQGLCLEERVMPNDAFSLMHVSYSASSTCWKI